MSISIDAWLARGREFEFNRRSIFYVDEGEGEPLLCIHGFPTASWDWARIWPSLTARYRVVAPDMLGFGFSAKPNRHRYSILEQAMLHEHLLETLQIPRVHILAHNYGDTVAQELLARYENRSASGDRGVSIRSVCFLNGGLFPEEHRPRLIQRLLNSRMGALIGRLTTYRTFRKSFSEIFGPDTKPAEEDLRQFWHLIEYNGGRHILHRLIYYMQERVDFNERWVGALQEASVPICFINGAEDPVSGRHMAEAFRRTVPRGAVVELEGIGHYPQVEAAAQTIKAFFEFIDSAT